MNAYRISSIALVILVGTGLASAVTVGNIQNPSFENVPSSATGQGLLPTNWAQVGGVPPGADTYSNDGSYGLSPSAFGNFPGATAPDGIRWIAGGAFGDGTPEAFGQQMAAPLVANRFYTLTAQLRQSDRSDINNSGSYVVSIASDLNRSNEVSLGTLVPPTAAAGSWDPAALAWDTIGVSQADLNNLGYIIFTPVSFEEGDNTYPGLDNLVLDEEVPEPVTMALLGLGGLGLVVRKRRRK